MKRNLYILSLLLMSTAAFVSCAHDDWSDPVSTEVPEKSFVTISSRTDFVFIINNKNTPTITTITPFKNFSQIWTQSLSELFKTKT